MYHPPPANLHRRRHPMFGLAERGGREKRAIFCHAKTDRFDEEWTRQLRRRRPRPIFSHFHDWRASEIQSVPCVVRVSLKWSGFALFVIRWSHSAARFPLVGICSGCQNGCDAKSIRGEGGRPSNQHTNTFLLSLPPLCGCHCNCSRGILQINRIFRARAKTFRGHSAPVLFIGVTFSFRLHIHGSSKRHFGMAGLKRGGER